MSLHKLACVTIEGLAIVASQKVPLSIPHLTIALGKKNKNKA
jgi:hypothetical protein